jgi:predicted ATP-dependent protease
MSEQTLTHDQIRAIRGDKTRAELARLLGVTPLTVYRWELPPSAAQARRPRRAMQKKLHQLAAAAKPEAQTVSAELAQTTFAESASAVAGDEAQRAAFGRTSPASSEPVWSENTKSKLGPARALSPMERAALLPVLGDIAYASWQRAEQELIDILSGGRLASSGHVIAQVAMGMIQLLGRNDARGAFASVLPALNVAAGGQLADEAVFRVHMVAALLFSTADGQLFDPGRVRTHAARAERVPLPHGGQDLLALLRMGQLEAARQLGELSLFRQLLERFRSELEAAQQPMTCCLRDHLWAKAAYLSGHSAEAQQRFGKAAERAQQTGFVAAECRARARLALLKLEGAAPTAEVLGIVEQVRDAATAARLEPRRDDILLAAVAAETRVRVGQLKAAQAELDRGLEVAERIGWPPIDLVFAAGRVYGNAEGLAWLEALWERLSRWEGGKLGGAVSGASTLVRAETFRARGDFVAAGRAFAHAAELAALGGMEPWMTRHARLGAYQAATLTGDTAAGERELRRLERLLERQPSAWHTAKMRCVRGFAALAAGSGAVAVRELETAIATFQLAGDRPFAALARYGRRIADHRVQQRSGGMATTQPLEDELTAASESLSALGVQLPTSWLAEALTSRIEDSANDDGRAPRENGLSLAVPITRLAVRGATQPMILQELANVVSEMAGTRAWIEEVDSDGNVLRLLSDQAPQGAGPSFEFGDGCGRRFRLRVYAALPNADQVHIQAAITVAALALEVAGLRSLTAEKTTEKVTAARVAEVPGIVASSAAMRELVADVVRLAGSRATVLINGESGTGKEVLARAIHHQSPRAKRPYVTFNCAAIPRDLFEGQLFGYRRGAFTGATSSHPGVIRAADGGTLFLDEIGDLPLDMQPKLLRFLENGEVLPLGETAASRVDVRVIAATHRDLEEMMRTHQFREDLFYRLQVVTMAIPPLRERRDDVPALARHFVRRLTPEGQEPPSLSQHAISALLTHTWPGNVREVRNVIERALAFSPLPSVLTAEHLRIQHQR